MQPKNACLRADQNSIAKKDEVPRLLYQKLSQQDALLGELHGAISNLERQLDTLMDPDSPQTQGGPDSPSSNQITNTLNIHNESLNGIIRRVTSIMIRLHV